MPFAAMLAAFAAALLGGVHCIAMCGGWTLLAGAQRERDGFVPLRPRRALRVDLAGAHLGRLATYAALGALLGAAGGGATALMLAPAHRAAYVAANLVLIALAVTMTRRAVRAPAVVEQAGLTLYRRAATPLLALSAYAPGIRPLITGSLWGLTPCALVYGVLPVALMSGDALDGAAIMLAFGIGTLPNLLVAHTVLARFRGILRARGVRLVVASIVAAFGVVGIHRALAAPDALASGAYCLVLPDLRGTLDALWR